VSACKYNHPTIHQWFSDFLETDCFLAQHVHSDVDTLKPAASHDGQNSLGASKGEKSARANALAFSNESPFLLITIPSVAALQKQMPETGSDGASRINNLVMCFRPNLVLDFDGPTCESGYAEDTWMRLQIAGQVFEV
jgi:uncharacterized protein YcbX